MSKKDILCFLFVLLFLPTIFAYDVAYIAKTSGNVDKNIISSFSNMNMSVGIVLDKNARTTDFSKYKLIFISDNSLRETSKYYDIAKYKTIAVNKNYGKEFGLTGDDGITQLVGNSPLEIIYRDELIQVYTRALNKNGLAIPYYYLADIGKAQGLQSIAREYEQKNYDIGDVIAVAGPGLELKNGKTTREKICFFGIAKTDYWTPYSKKLFEEECIGFVAYDIICSKNADCDDGDNYTKDICVNPGKVGSYCEHKRVQCFSKSDCGIDGFTGNKFCSAKNIMQNFVSYTCNNAGTPESSCAYTNINKLIEGCSDICLDGKCYDVKCSKNADCDDGDNYTIDECVFPGTTQSVCRNTRLNCALDSDCGFTGFIGQEYCNVNDVFKNFQNANCVNPGTTNSFCNLEIEQTKVNDCPYSCNNGVCIRCSENADCDDADSSTKDTCVMAGTINSYCKNEKENIACNSNSQCGTNGFVGDKFCSENDVKRNYIEYKCNNPGTGNSFCSSNTDVRLIQDCVNFCAKGICIVTICANDLQCNDNNPLTLDTCVNPGTSISQCRHDPINCASNLDCGYTGFIGQEYCNVNDVFKNFQNANCVNPGTTNSFCNLEIEQTKVNDCPYSCNNGVCIRCNANSDCDDGIASTIDKCINPGTKESYCKNDDSICGENRDSKFEFSTLLIANDPNYVIPNPLSDFEMNVPRTVPQENVKNLVNGHYLPEGNYVAQIKEGSISRWLYDSQDTSQWGGSPGLTWEASANIAFNQSGIIKDIRMGKGFFPTAILAESATKGEKIFFEHTGGKVYIFIDDQPINDNRGAVRLDVYSCKETSI